MITKAGSVIVARQVDTLEVEIWRHYFARQFAVLSRRHAPETAILLRAIADYCRLPVDYANKGQLEEARTAASTLDRLTPSNDAELVAVASVAVRPVWALIHWREGSTETANELLLAALDDSRVLASEYDHDYLTARRIHLAANTARVLINQGRPDEALSRGNDLACVARGDLSRWQFGGHETLDVPLIGAEDVGITRQLANLARAAGAFDEHKA